jgi:hypothetical protein
VSIKQLERQLARAKEHDERSAAEKDADYEARLLRFKRAEESRAASAQEVEDLWAHNVTAKSRFHVGPLAAWAELNGVAVEGHLKDQLWEAVLPALLARDAAAAAAGGVPPASADDMDAHGGSGGEEGDGGGARCGSARVRCVRCCPRRRGRRRGRRRRGRCTRAAGGEAAADGGAASCAAGG